MTETTAFRFQLPQDLHLAAKIKSAKTGVSIAEICRQALTSWLQQEEGQPVETSHDQDSKK